MSSRSSIRRRPAHTVSKQRLARAPSGARVPSVRPSQVVVDIVNQQKSLRISAARIRRVVRRTLEAERVGRATISVALVDNRIIHELNRQHLNHDYETDVLSFLFESETSVPVPAEMPSNDGGTDRYIDGEIVISAEMAVQTALRFGWSAQKELELYLIHGLLHLCGYDDGTVSQRRLMRRRERSILKLIGD